MDIDLMTTDDAAKELGVTPTRIRAMIRAGRLKAKVFGVPPRITYLILPADLDAVRDRKPGRPVTKVAAPVAEAAPKKGRGKLNGKAKP
jgi:excisionase family DNA binding protein